MAEYHLHLPVRRQSPIRFTPNAIEKQPVPKVRVTKSYAYTVISGRVIATRNELVRQCSTFPVED